MIVIIDNYDSFTYNIVHYVGDIGYESIVIRNDETSVSKIKEIASSIIISPGPCTPNEAGISLNIVKELADTIPILGICLGHQSIAQSYGAKIIKSELLMHGKVDKIIHNSHSLFDNIPNNFNATRYHSLTVKEETIPECLNIIARSEKDNSIMAISHKNLPVFGLQFHPESISSEYGHQILKNFLKKIVK
ncbi:MAG: anthranilate synthase/aminodeoxychorismate synthase-like glutamine amidotransferase [Alphaproteobacteria bacterium]|jgi:anthranilate synthase/aminodeoxychorismate synthase-like glutamine amidotransferase